MLLNSLAVAGNEMRMPVSQNGNNRPREEHPWHEPTPIDRCGTFELASTLSAKQRPSRSAEEVLKEVLVSAA